MSRKWSVYTTGSQSHPAGAESSAGQELLLESRSVEELVALRDRLDLQYGKIKDKLGELIAKRYDEIMDVSQLLNSSEYFQPLKDGLSLLKDSMERTIIFGSTIQEKNRVAEDPAGDNEVETALIRRLLFDSPKQVYIALEEREIFRAALWINLVKALLSNLSDAVEDLKTYFPCVFSQCSIALSLEGRLAEVALEVLRSTSYVNEIHGRQEGKNEERSSYSNSGEAARSRALMTIAKAVAVIFVLDYCKYEELVAFFFGEKQKQFRIILNDIFTGRKIVDEVGRHYEFTLLLFQSVDITSQVLFNAEKVLREVPSHYICPTLMDTMNRLYSSNSPPSHLFNIASRGLSEKILDVISRCMGGKVEMLDECKDGIQGFLKSTSEIFTQVSVQGLSELSPKGFIFFMRETFKHFFCMELLGSSLSSAHSDLREVKSSMVSFWAMSYPPLYKKCMVEIVNRHYSALAEKCKQEIITRTDNYDDAEAYLPNILLECDTASSSNALDISRRNGLLNVINEAVLSCREQLSCLFSSDTLDFRMDGADLESIEAAETLKDIFSDIRRVSDMEAIEVLNTILSTVENTFSSISGLDDYIIEESLLLPPTRFMDDLEVDIELSTSVFAPHDKTTPIAKFEEVKHRVRQLSHNTKSVWVDNACRKITEGIFSSFEKELPVGSDIVSTAEDPIGTNSVIRCVTELFVSFADNWYKLGYMGLKKGIIDNMVCTARRMFIQGLDNFVEKHIQNLKKHVSKDILFNVFYVFFVLGCNKSTIFSLDSCKKLIDAAGASPERVDGMANRTREIASGHSLLLGPLGAPLLNKGGRVVDCVPACRQPVDYGRVLGAYKLKSIALSTLPGEEDTINYPLPSRDHFSESVPNANPLHGIELDEIVLNLKDAMSALRVSSANLDKKPQPDEDQNPESSPLQASGKSRSSSIITNAAQFLTGMLKNNSLI